MAKDLALIPCPSEVLRALTRLERRVAALEAQNQQMRQFLKRQAERARPRDAKPATQH